MAEGTGEKRHQEALVPRRRPCHRPRLSCRRRRCRRCCYRRRRRRYRHHEAANNASAPPTTPAPPLPPWQPRPPPLPTRVQCVRARPAGGGAPVAAAVAPVTPRSTAGSLASAVGGSRRPGGSLVDGARCRRAASPPAVSVVAAPLPCIRVRRRRPWGGSSAAVIPDRGRRWHLWRWRRQRHRWWLRWLPPRVVAPVATATSGLPAHPSAPAFAPLSAPAFPPLPRHPQGMNTAGRDGQVAHDGGGPTGRADSSPPGRRGAPPRLNVPAARTGRGGRRGGTQPAESGQSGRANRRRWEGAVTRRGRWRWRGSCTPADIVGRGGSTRNAPARRCANAVRALGARGGRQRRRYCSTWSTRLPVALTVAVDWPRWDRPWGGAKLVVVLAKDRPIVAPTRLAPPVPGGGGAKLNVAIARLHPPPAPLPACHRATPHRIRAVSWRHSGWGAGGRPGVDAARRHPAWPRRIISVEASSSSHSQLAGRHHPPTHPRQPHPGNWA